ncbi:MAG: hypothetical protein LUG23_09485 [Oscillospiraceae bacterium]|nr:hypothetical protein [Oscillospiraceae bacterium]
MSKIMDDFLKEVTVMTAIDIWGELELSEDKILNKLMNKYDLNRIEAEAYLAKSKISA